MNNKYIILSREELYERVWTKPMSELASEYGMSDKGLAKKCKRHHVPTPPRGYWARKQYGKKVGRPKLRSIDEPLLEKIVIYEKQGKPSIPPPAVEDDARVALAKDFRMPSRVSSYHPSVSKFRAAVRQDRVSRYGFFQVKDQTLDILVTKQTYRRALRFYHGFLKLAKKCGFKIDVSDPDRSGRSMTSINVDGEKLQVRLKEKVVQVPHNLTDREIEGKRKWGSAYAPKYDYEATGKLSLVIEEPALCGVKKIWIDKPESALEQQLDTIVSGLIAAASAHRINRLEWEEWNRKFMQEWRESDLRRKAAETEKARLDLLLVTADKWRRAELADKFLNSIEAQSRGNSEHPSADISTWVKWAKEKVFEDNPINNLEELLKKDRELLLQMEVQTD